MGRPYKINPTQEAVLLEIVRSDSFATMGEVRAELQRRTGIEAHEQTILKALLRLGVERRKGSDAAQINHTTKRKPRLSRQGQARQPTSGAAGFPESWPRSSDRTVGVLHKAQAGSTRYGHNDHHRSQNEQQQFSSCLTDREWSLVEDIFAFEGGRGIPPKIPRRQLLDACCYVVRTGCSWRMLPPCFGRWKNVYKTFRRWSDLGKFERMHDRLRADWRERAGHAEAPTAAVLDA